VKGRNKKLKAKSEEKVEGATLRKKTLEGNQAEERGRGRE
jgi:hypothetical protein